MTRGKYAEKAAKRRAELEVTTDLASYQHRVAKLTEENRDLRQQLNEQRHSFAATERRLRAQRDEGVGPQVEAMRLVLKGEQDRSLERLRRIGHHLGRLIEEHEWRLSDREWSDLIAVLGGGVELLGVSDGSRNQRRNAGNPKFMRHWGQVLESGLPTGRVGPGSSRNPNKITDA